MERRGGVHLPYYETGDLERPRQPTETALPLLHPTLCVPRARFGWWDLLDVPPPALNRYPCVG